ncbi:MAG: MarR family transcriptional regulator [Hyphomicrobiales bacterium]|nr:MarR family transcriptional regulator [Hyphomicrobiales bacterium]
MEHTPEAAAFTNLILEVFRLNGKLLSEGDRLTKPVGLTSARWQVLGAIDIAGHSLTAPQISRRIGSSRQAVQRIVNDLERLGFVATKTNPDHVRAKLIEPTATGNQALSRIRIKQLEWSNDLVRGMDADQLNEAVKVLKELLSRCENLKFTEQQSTVAAL